MSDFNISATMPVIGSYEAYVKEIQDIWQTGAMTNNGPKVQRLKVMLQDYLNLDNLDLFVNGHAALYLAIKAFGFKRGSEVITSPFTFVSTTNAIIQNGLEPVFCDIDDTYNIDPIKIEENITEKTVAIVAPHIFGIPCDVYSIQEIADRHKLKVIYDGAQAFGTKINGNAIGKYGDATMFSFHAIKVYNSVEGGMISYRETVLHDYFEHGRNFGIEYLDKDRGDTDVVFEGINAKMDEFRAAMGIVNLLDVDDEILRRKKIAEFYISELKDVRGIWTYPYRDDIQYNYAYFPIRIHPEYPITRDELWSRLKEKGIGTRKLYDRLICDFSFYKESGFKRKTPYADEIKKVCLDLPIYGSLTYDELGYICDTIRGFCL